MSLFTKEAGVWTERVPFAKKVTGYAGSNLTVKVEGEYVPKTPAGENAIVFAADAGTVQIQQTDPSLPMVIKLRNTTTNTVTDLGSHLSGYVNVEVPLGGPYHIEIFGALDGTNANNNIEVGFNSLITSIVSIDDTLYQLKTYPKVNSGGLVSVPNNLPPSVINLIDTFSNCPNFNSDIGNWDTSRVILMQSTFARAASFNQDISRWDVSNVTQFIYVFREATAFNQDLPNWDTGNAEIMVANFLYASSFNGDISGWTPVKCYIW